MEKKMSKSLTCKYGQKLLETKSAIDFLKTASKTAIPKTRESSSDLIGSKIVEKIVRTVTKNTHKYPEKSITQILQPSIP